VSYKYCVDLALEVHMYCRPDVSLVNCKIQILRQSLIGTNLSISVTLLVCNMAQIEPLVRRYCSVLDCVHEDLLAIQSTVRVTDRNSGTSVSKVMKKGSICQRVEWFQHWRQWPGITTYLCRQPADSNIKCTEYFKLLLITIYSILLSMKCLQQY
jgi:hypothetical protein